MYYINQSYVIFEFECGMMVRKIVMDRHSVRPYAHVMETSGVLFVPTLLTLPIHYIYIGTTMKAAWIWTERTEYNRHGHTRTHSNTHSVSKGIKESIALLGTAKYYRNERMGSTRHVLYSKTENWSNVNIDKNAHTHKYVDIYIYIHSFHAIARAYCLFKFMFDGVRTMRLNC